MYQLSVAKEKAISKLGGLKHNNLFAHTLGSVLLGSSSVGLFWSHSCSYSDLGFTRWIQDWPHPDLAVIWDCQQNASVLYVAASAAKSRCLTWQWQ